MVKLQNQGGTDEKVTVYSGFRIMSSFVVFCLCSHSVRMNALHKIVQKTRTAQLCGISRSKQLLEA